MMSICFHIACENPGHGTFASCTSSRNCNCNGQVRMGYGNRWTSWRDVSGSIQCTNGAFGGDPAPGQAKECVCDTGAALCIDDCNWVNDGDCDDGGPGWEYTLCDLGNDCTDCGARLCIDDCNWVSDGDCDDGGPGWEYTLCDLGTDCNWVNDGDCDDG